MIVLLRHLTVGVGEIALVTSVADMVSSEEILFPKYDYHVKKSW